MVKEHFLTCSWRFLRLDKLEQLKSELEKTIGIKKHAGKVRKSIFRGFPSLFLPIVQTIGQGPLNRYTVYMYLCTYGMFFVYNAY